MLKFLRYDDGIMIHFKKESLILEKHTDIVTEEMINWYLLQSNMGELGGDIDEMKVVMN